MIILMFFGVELKICNFFLTEFRQRHVFKEKHQIVEWRVVWSVRGASVYFIQSKYVFMHYSILYQDDGDRGVIE